ncbi:MAG TPA: lysylphosphatidylglycerol synthase transmembrane domain-containing protein [Longimicrobiaceae bacterium]|nr:lysylphosphatidylglycerol synthase transmembrane domain-containing protein [Longimicrobiaceae bacterium]
MREPGAPGELPPEEEPLHVWGMGDVARPPGKRRGRFTLERLFRLALLLIPVGVLGNLALSWATTDRSLLAELPQLPRGYLYLAVVLGLVPWFTNALRLWVWTRFIGSELSYREAFRIVLGGELGSSVLPTSTGGEIFRWGMMMQRGISPGAAASVITLGHVEDSLFFLLALPAAAVLSSAWELPILRSLAGEIEGNAVAALGAGLAALFVLRFLFRLVLLGRLGERPRAWGLRAAAKTRRRLRKGWREFRDVYRLVARRGKTRFLLTMGITAVQWSCRYSVAAALAAFLGASVDPVLFFLLQWVVFTVMLFIPTPGASGGAEAAFYLVYSALLPGRLIGLMTAGWRLLTFYLQLALGAVVFAGLTLADSRARRAAPPPVKPGKPAGR